MEKYAVLVGYIFVICDSNRKLEFDRNVKNDLDYDIDCLIQISQIERYKTLYPKVNFIDIQAERFYGLRLGIMDKVSQNKYERNIL